MSSLYIYEFPDLHKPEYIKNEYVNGEIIKQDDDGYLIAYDEEIITYDSLDND